jgi:hypothetical protein
MIYFKSKYNLNNFAIFYVNFFFLDNYILGLFL